MKQNNNFEKEFIINKTYTTNQNLNKNCDNLNLKPQNKKHKFTKIFGGVSLAVFMGVSTLCGVLISPINHNSNLSTTLGNTTANSSANSQDQTGLITPHEDDPVLFTTESGVDIKFGSKANGPGNLTSGALAGFPYFNTYVGSTPYTWVIIGRSPSLTSGDLLWSEDIYSNWITNTGYSKVNEFVNNQNETTTPAGSLVNTSATNASLIYEEIMNLSFANVTQNPEIPSGAVLCFANDVVATGNYSSLITVAENNDRESDSLRMPRLNYTTLGSTMEGYYTNGSWGLHCIKKAIPGVTLNSLGFSITGTINYNGTSSSVTGSSESSISNTYHVFSLSSGATTTLGTEQFAWTTYLNTDTAKGASIEWWLRTPEKATTGSAVSVTLSSWQEYGRACTALCVGTDGVQKAFNINTPSGKNYTQGFHSRGYRPAFCLSLI